MSCSRPPFPLPQLVVPLAPPFFLPFLFFVSLLASASVTMQGPPCRASVSIATVQALTGLSRSPPSLRSHSTDALSPLHSSQTPSPLSRVAEPTLIWKILRFLLRPMGMGQRTPGHPVVSISESLRLFSGHTLMALQLGTSALRSCTVSIGGFRGGAMGATASLFFLYFQNIFIRPQPF